MPFKEILIFSSCYLPGHKGGGPIRSISNLVEVLGGEFSFKVLTLDRDLNDKQKYPNIRNNIWQVVGKALVYYVSHQKITFAFLHKLIRDTHSDVIYLNSFFSQKFTIMPLVLRRLNLINAKTIIIAPRGEFSKSALRIKMWRKKIYISIAKLMKLYDDVIWQATTIHEKNDIISIFENARIAIAPAVPFVHNPNHTTIETDRSKHQYIKTSGILRLIFLSRISVMKNLDGALKALKTVTGQVLFDIYGPIEDPKYWNVCKEIIDKLPSNIKSSYKGELNHNDVYSTFNKYDVMILPTHGENYGHSILEALVSGCPVLISDKTPWRNLIKLGIGWDIPLEKPELFTETIQKCVDMEHNEWLKIANSAQEYGLYKIRDQGIIEQNRSLFLLE